MRMNPGIILSAQPLNVMNALMQGTQAAGQVQAFKHQNALHPHQLKAVELGNQRTNQLIEMHPLAMEAAELGNKQTRWELDHADENMRMRREEASRAAEAHVAAMTATERAMALEDVKQRAGRLRLAQTPEEWDAIAAEDEDTKMFVGKFDQRNDALAVMLGAWDALMAVPGEPAAILALRIRAQEAGLTPGTPEYQQFMAQGGAGKSSRISVGADGSVEITEGTASTGSPPKLTVDAGKNTGYYIRTQDAHETLNELEDEGLSFIQQNLEGLPLGTGNYMRSPKFQRFDQARRDFVNAVLRRESGAVISDSEFENANKQYFPQPGDSPEVIAQKRKNRENTIEGLRIGSGEGAAYADATSQEGQQDAPEAGGSSSQAPVIDDPEIQRLYDKYGQTSQR